MINKDLLCGLRIEMKCLGMYVPRPPPPPPVEENPAAAALAPPSDATVDTASEGVAALAKDTEEVAAAEGGEK